jgi:lipopolysaccharide export system protein LptA
MATNQPLQVAYGLSQPLINVFPTPIASTRNPLGSDKAQLGTIWVNTASNDAFVLCSVTANVANWIGVGGGSGLFTSLVVNPGNLTVTAGNLLVGGTGNITAAGGNITATSGSITAGNGLTVSTGDAVVSSGNLVLTAGNISVTLGNLTVSAGAITATAGEIQAIAGAINGAQLEATGDLGGVVSTTSITNATNTSLSTGTLSIKSTSANPGNNAGFIKVYVGATTAYVPYFTNIAP